MGDHRHPFDPRVSHREPFPSFDAAMASAASGNADASEGDDDESDTRASGQGGDLDWSIDTIAELKPATFSPLPAQKAAAAEHDDAGDSFTPSTAAKRAQFFDDAAQYKVLQTPSPLVRQERAQREQPPPTLRHATRRLLPRASASATDLHSRCQDAIAFFGDRLRERERKLSHLQLPQSQPPVRMRRANGATNKRHRPQGDGDFPWRATTPRASAELKGIHPRTPASESRSSRSVQSRMTPRTQDQRECAEPAFSFGDTSPLSPIVPCVRPSSSATATALAPRRSDDESLFAAGVDGDKLSGLLSPISHRAHHDTLPFESPPGFSDDDRDKENDSSRRQSQQQRQRHDDDASMSFTGLSSSAAASLSLSASTSWGKAVETSLSLQTLAMLQEGAVAAVDNDDDDVSTRDTTAASRHRDDTVRRNDNKAASLSITRRQEAFVAAIEAEAAATDATDATVPLSSQ